MIVVSDTSPISNLFLIGKLWILPQVYGNVIVPPAVMAEIEALSQFGIDLKEIHAASWIVEKPPKNSNAVNRLLSTLDEGEAQAIVLAEELSADYLLIDERLGWKEAERKGLRITGLLGTLVKAKEIGVIDAVKPAISALRNETSFRMSEHLIQHVLRIANEI